MADKVSKGDVVAFRLSAHHLTERLGVLPPTEEAMRHLIAGVEPTLGRLGMSLTEAVELIEAEVHGVLSGRQLAIKELGAELAKRSSGRLPKKHHNIWEEIGPQAPGQPLGEAVVHFCVRILTLRRIVCFASRAGNKAPDHRHAGTSPCGWGSTPVTPILGGAWSRTS